MVIARDKNVAKIKGKFPHWDEKKRLKKVEEFLKKSKDNKIILGHKTNFLFHIKKYLPQIIALGHDQKGEEWLKEALENHHLQTKIIRLKAYFPEKYKTSLIRTNI